MTTKKKGILLTSREWVKHLRPKFKRIFWSSHRIQEKKLLKKDNQD